MNSRSIRRIYVLYCEDVFFFHDEKTSHVFTVPAKFKYVHIERAYLSVIT